MFKQVIYYFIAVVEQGSFSKAAKKFYLSQSAISQQITKLENDLGFSLFDRRTYYPTLTEEGKRYYDLAKKLLSDYKNEYNDIKENLQKDVLTIGITGPFERKHVPLLLNNSKKTILFQLISKLLIYLPVLKIKQSRNRYCFWLK